MSPAGVKIRPCYAKQCRFSIQLAAILLALVADCRAKGLRHQWHQTVSDVPEQKEKILFAEADGESGITGSSSSVIPRGGLCFVAFQVKPLAFSFVVVHPIPSGNKIKFSHDAMEDKAEVVFPRGPLITFTVKKMIPPGTVITWSSVKRGLSQGGQVWHVQHAYPFGVFYDTMDKTKKFRGRIQFFAYTVTVVVYFCC